MPAMLSKRCEISNQLANADLKNIFLSRNEVAALAGMGRRTLEELASKGKGPIPLKIGHRTVRYRASDVIAWLESLASKTP